MVRRRMKNLFKSSNKSTIYNARENSHPMNIIVTKNSNI